MSIGISPNIAKVAAILSEESRSLMLISMLDGVYHSASELALKAKIKPQTASFHLSKMLEYGLIIVEKQGRHRYYKIASSEVAKTLEEFLTISPVPQIKSLNQSIDKKAIYYARTCYDHLAGELGVRLTEAMIKNEVLEEGTEHFILTAKGEEFFTNLGIDITSIQKMKRSFSRKCLDWSERKFHLAGSLGKALFLCFLEKKWIKRLPSTRAIQITDIGKSEINKVFKLQL